MGKCSGYSAGTCNYGICPFRGNEAEVNGYSNASLLVSGQELNDHLGESGIRILDVRAAGPRTAQEIPR